jgi:hypothetical protein
VDRRRALLASFGAVLLLVAIVVVLVLRDDPAPSTRIAAGDAMATSTTAVATTTTTEVLVTTTSEAPPTSAMADPKPPSTAPTGRRLLLTDRDGKWRLEALDTGAQHCVEIVAGEVESGPLLCDAAATTRPVGDIVAFDVGAHRMMVAVADPSLTGFTGYPRASGNITNDQGQVGVDPDRPGMAYIAGFAALHSHPAVDVILFSAPHTVGHVLLPEHAGVVTAAAVEIRTTSPYGRWPGYRKAANTAFLWGSPADVGFYDGPAGTTCVLYRRYGRSPQVLGDVCAPAAPTRAITAATLTVDRDSYAQSWLQPTVVLDSTVAGWHCELSSGEQSTVSPGFYPDPRGGRFIAGVPRNSLLNPFNASSVTIVATDRTGAEVDRLSLPVPGRTPTSSTTTTTTTTSASTTTTTPG